MKVLIAMKEGMSTPDIIRKFVQSLEMPKPTYIYDPVLRSRVWELVGTCDFASDIRPSLSTGITLVETSYTYITDVNTKTAIALYCAFFGYIDCIERFNALEAKHFPRRLFCPSPDDSSFLVSLRALLLSMWEWYPDFGANAILYSGLQFINGSMLESVPRQAKVIKARTLPFVELRRNLSGIPDPFFCFIWEKSLFPDEKLYADIIP